MGSRARSSCTLVAMVAGLPVPCSWALLIPPNGDLGGGGVWLDAWGPGCPSAEVAGSAALKCDLVVGVVTDFVPEARGGSLLKLMGSPSLSMLAWGGVAGFVPEAQGGPLLKPMGSPHSQCWPGGGGGFSAWAWAWLPSMQRDLCPIPTPRG